MNNLLRFKSVRSRFIFCFLLLALTPLFIVGVVVSAQRVSSIKQEAFSKLTAIRDLKVEQINLWLNERLSDINSMAGDREMQTIDQLIGTGAVNHAAITSLRQMLEGYVHHSPSHDEVFILHPLSGKVLLSSNQASEGADKGTRPYFTEPLRTRQPYISDIVYSQATRQTAMFFSAPIFSHANPKALFGILVARINLSISLYALLIDRTGMGATGETLLVNRQGVALSDLRWYNQAPLNLKISDQPAVRAAQEETGIIEAPDYRGVPVLAAYTFIHHAGWGFVAKQDQDEIYTPIHALLRNLVIIWAISGAVVLIISTLVARNIAAPVLEIASVAQQLQAGELTVRSRLRRNDELGQLAGSFNRMADTITFEMGVRQGIAELAGVMMAVEEIATFARVVPEKLADLTGSDLAAFFLRKETGNSFVLSFSRGLSTELGVSFTAEPGEGEFGRALSTKGITHISEIPPNTRFTFKTFTGTILPRELITIPVLVKDQVRAVISLASLTGYTSLQLEIFNRVWPNINIVFANLQAGEATSKLAANLDASNRELQAQKQELLRQADELQAHNLELEFQRRQVEEANRLKGEFLSNMSHELRTPLNSVMALSRVLILQAGGRLSTEETGYLEVIERNGKQLLNLINDILDLAKIESGKMEINPSLFPIRATLETLIETSEALARQKGIEIRRRLSPDLPLMESDEGRVHQILQNILANAVKFTSQGHITVSAEPAGQQIVISIADTGIGISSADLPYIFDEFRQADGSTSRHYGGTGLGLTIARKAALLLGGEIRVQSEPGQGSVFTVVLPLRSPGAVLLPSAPPLPLAPAAGPGVPGRHILLVEDNEAAIIQVEKVLAGAGYEVAIARGGQEALDYVAHTVPDGIILDLMMPEIDGFTVMERIRRLPATEKVPILVLTAKDLTREELQRIQSNHISQLIRKGDIDLQDLLARISAVLKPLA